MTRQTGQTLSPLPDQMLAQSVLTLLARAVGLLNDWTFLVHPFNCQHQHFQRRSEALYGILVPPEGLVAHSPVARCMHAARCTTGYQLTPIGCYSFGRIVSFLTLIVGMCLLKFKSFVCPSKYVHLTDAAKRVELPSSSRLPSDQHLAKLTDASWS